MFRFLMPTAVGGQAGCPSGTSLSAVGTGGFQAEGKSSAYHVCLRPPAR